MTAKGADANRERAFAKRLARTCWNGTSGLELREGCCGQFLPAAETHPPARTLLVVRTGASVTELSDAALADHRPESNFRDGLGPSQHSNRARLVHHLSVRIPDLHLAQIQLLHVLF